MFIVAVPAFALLAVLLTLGAIQGEPTAGDVSIGQALQGLPGGAILEYAADILALPGVMFAFWFCGALAAMRKRDTRLVVASFLVLVALSANPVLKDLVERGRPTADELTIREASPGWGFPSGHAMRATLMFGYAGAAILILQLGRWGQLFAATCATSIVLIGFDRVYDGAHWPSDVAGGVAFGSLALWLSLWLASTIATLSAGGGDAGPS